jgi:hypothetical protein
MQVAQFCSAGSASAKLEVAGVASPFMREDTCFLGEKEESLNHDGGGYPLSWQDARVEGRVLWLQADLALTTVSPRLRH